MRLFHRSWSDIHTSVNTEAGPGAATLGGASEPFYHVHHTNKTHKKCHIFSQLLKTVQSFAKTSKVLAKEVKHHGSNRFCVDRSGSCTLGARALTGPEHRRGRGLNVHSSTYNKMTNHDVDQKPATYSDEYYREKASKSLNLVHVQT